VWGKHGKHESTVLGLGLGCFGELPEGFSDVCTFIEAKGQQYMNWWL